MPEDEGSYEIMPYKEIVALKKDIESLKNSKQVSSDDLFGSLESLSKNMGNMLQLFKIAAEEMKLEQQTEESFSSHVEPINEKLDQVIEQNKVIAEGLVAMADLVKELAEEIKGKKQENSFAPRNHSMPPPLKVDRIIPPPGAPPGPMPSFGAPPGPMPSFGAPLGPLPPGAPMPPLGPPPQGPPPQGPMPPSGLPPLGPEPPKKRGLFGRKK